MGNPLVSVVVVTYNSARFVTDTLESIYEQTYQEVELIVTDDCSTDNTNDIVRIWIQNHSNRFVRCSHIIAPHNGGIGKNNNCGLKECRGEWIKFIGGDDALTTDSIEKYVDYVSKNPMVVICYADYELYKDVFDKNNRLKKTPLRYSVFRDNEKSPLIKLWHLFFYNEIFAPGIFIKSDYWLKRGGYDETFPLCDDLPTWTAVLSEGINIFYMDRTTVKYRLHSDSINAKYALSCFFSHYFDVEDYIYRKYLKGNAPMWIIIPVRYNYYLRRFFVFAGIDKKTKLNKLIYLILNTPYLFAKNYISNRTSK